MGIHFFLALPDSDQRFLINYCPGETESVRLSVSISVLSLKSLDKKCVEQQKSFSTEVKQVSPFFMSISTQIFLLRTCLVRRKLSHGNNKSGRFLPRLLEFAAVQHLCPTLFLFHITFAPDKLLWPTYYDMIHSNFSFFRSISSAILKARRLLSPACMQLPVFSGISVLFTSVSVKVMDIYLHFGE